jgi:hypothetical protein
MRRLTFGVGVLLLAAGAIPAYPIECMALWVPGCALVLAAYYHPNRG